MDYEMGSAGEGRLNAFFDKFGDHLGPAGRESFAVYAMGILGDGERKSVEPIAARLSASPKETQREHDRLLYFLRQMPWSDEAVRREAARYAARAMKARRAITCSIVDDTGFLKQGKHSVGVQRQYTGSAGKIANCQLGVSLTLANDIDQVPVDMQLYLPKSWTESTERRERARIPEDITFKTKPEMALDMIQRAHAEGFPLGVVLGDSAFGTSKAFRDGLLRLQIPYAVAVRDNVLVHLVARGGRPSREPQAIADIAAGLRRSDFQTIRWREGTRRTLFSKFCFFRVAIPHETTAGASEFVHQWLILEWPDDEAKPKCALATLPATMRKNQIIDILKQRWRTERAYQDLKGELGLDHFEGRSFPGWHHHVSVVLACYAFVVAERIRAFPPSYARARRPLALRVAA